MTNLKAKGRRYEYKYRDLLKEEGFTEVIRSAASRSCFDLIAWDSNRILGAQVKYRVFNKKELDEFKKVEFPGIKRFVVYKRKKGFCIIWSNEN